MPHIKEIETVLHNNVVIGFRCRRNVVFGTIQEIPDGWIVGQLQSNCIVFQPTVYETREAAASALRRRVR